MLPANMPMAPPEATNLPRLIASFWSALISTRRLGDCGLMISTLEPAARTISPLGVWITPWFSTLLPTKYTKPPLCVTIVPWLITLALPGTASNLNFPPSRSALLMPRLDATKPAVSINAPAPMVMPLGLIRNTFPLDARVPRIELGSLPMTRLNTAEAALC